MAGMRFFKTYLELILDTCLEKLAKKSGKPVPDDVLERNAILREENLTASDLRRLSSGMQSPNTSGSIPKKSRSWMSNPMEKPKSMANLKSKPERDIEMTMLDVNFRTNNKAAADGELNNENDMVTRYEMNQRLEMQSQENQRLQQQIDQLMSIVTQQHSGSEVKIDDELAIPSTATTNNAASARRSSAIRRLSVMKGKKRRSSLKATAPIPQPEESHRRNSTQLPENWNKNLDDEGRTYYANASTQESSWTPPPGSSGGSAEADLLSM